MGRLDDVNLDETLAHRAATARLAHAPRRLTAPRLPAGARSGARHEGPV